LELKANRRYGVVGHNGAGKTTLMKEIVNRRIVGMPQDLTCTHVSDERLSEMRKSTLTAFEWLAKEGGFSLEASKEVEKTFNTVGFPGDLQKEPVAELSVGWRMRLVLCVSMLKKAEVVLLDEPTNHLDEESVDWLSDYLLGLKESSIMVISHEPRFLNKICTDIISYQDRKLIYTKGNFDDFILSKGISKDDIEALLAGNYSLDTKKEGEEEEEAKIVVERSGPAKLAFPIPGTLPGNKSTSRPVVSAENIWFSFNAEKGYMISGCEAKLTLSSRVALCGRNGCGKSTLMTILCSQLSPSESPDGVIGEVKRDPNLRMAYMPQDHLTALGPWFDASPYVYLQNRFQNGYDGELQKRLIEPQDQEEAVRRAELAKQYGKYGNQVDQLLGRTKKGNEFYYEVQWQGLDDPKQNTQVALSTLRKMGLSKVAIACDERLAAKAAGLDQVQITRRLVTRHCEAFGIDEEMCLNRQIRGFSAGQKVRLSLAGLFWTKPHLIALDEPTNYLDVETVDALAKALKHFRGGILMIEPKTEFCERVCNERWIMQDGKLTTEKMDNENARIA